MSSIEYSIHSSIYGGVTNPSHMTQASLKSPVSTAFDAFSLSVNNEETSTVVVLSLRDSEARLCGASEKIVFRGKQTRLTL